MSEALADGVGLKVIEQFEDQEQQRNAGQLGMWAWLVTELLLFAGCSSSPPCCGCNIRIRCTGPWRI